MLGVYLKYYLILNQYYLLYHLYLTDLFLILYSFYLFYYICKCKGISTVLPNNPGSLPGTSVQPFSSRNLPPIEGSAFISSLVMSAPLLVSRPLGDHSGKPCGLSISLKAALFILFPPCANTTL